MTPVEVQLYLTDTEAPLLKRRDDLLAGVARFQAKYPKITNDEDQAKASDFAKQIMGAIKISKDHFTPAKKPFLDGGRAVDAFFKGIAEPLEYGLNKVRATMTVYANEQEQIRRAEAQRKAAEAAAEARRVADELAEQQRLEAERAAAKARDEYVAPAPDDVAPLSLTDVIVAAQAKQDALKEATARPADLSRTRGEMGSVSSLRERISVELIDISLVPLEFLIFNERAAIIAVQNGRTDIPGVEIIRSNHIQVR
jgi:regulator of protease activity HflC (stomatin/prohibitin superfamily)